MKILVLGGTGMIGHRMWATLSKSGHEVYATCRSKNIDQFLQIPGISFDKAILNIDVIDNEGLEKVFQDIKPNIVLNCVGIVKQLKESKNAITSIEVNALFPHKLANICKNYNSRMIQFSTDCVFSGDKGKYTEADHQDASDLYGKSKILGEVFDQKHVLTIRTSTIGREINPHGGLMEWFLSQEGKKIGGYNKALYSGMPTLTLAKYINKYILPNEDLHGIYHVAAETINKYELLNLIKKSLNFNIEIEKQDEFIVKRDLDPSRFLKTVNAPLLKWDNIVDDLKIDQEIYNNL